MFMVKAGFMYIVAFSWVIGGQGEGSCAKSGIGKTPQNRKRRGGTPAARGKRSLARKSTAV
ncbi:hypothetical protein [Priestia megaterium]|uniref:hypothetical protein n=2 Tax=Bacillaceae TaxID=186817 RepID=UPI00221F0090|nr:hypothetical protein [Priestia megaterium]UYV51111.1 hypothetical protein OHU65_16070 [Priestia megaterium]